MLEMCLIFVGSYKQVSSSYKSDQKNIWLPRLNYFLGKNTFPLISLLHCTVFWKCSHTNKSTICVDSKKRSSIHEILIRLVKAHSAHNQCSSVQEQTPDQMSDEK